MGNIKFKRSVFFWIDKLQISKQERISITVLLGLILVLLALNIFIREKVVPTPENHTEMLAEFERRSALIQTEKDKIEARYNPGITLGTVEEVKPEERDIEILDLNQATSEELETLPGIGKSYAQRIIEYRETNGGFNSVDDLIKVKGIGDKTLEKLRPYLKL